MSNLDGQLSKLHITKEQKPVPGGRGGMPWFWLFTAVAIAAAAGFAYSRANAPVEVKTARVEQEAVIPGKGPALVTASGYVVPRHKVEVSAKVIGTIREAMVKRGDRVNKGDILLKIEDEEFQARAVAAEAQVAMLQARVAELKAGSRPEEIGAAEAQAASAEATLRDAERVLQRMEALHAVGASSKEEMERARTNRNVAQAQLEAARKTARLVAIGPRKEHIEGASAQLREAEANLALARTELGYTLIRAPISGTILEKLAEEGELVTSTNFGGTRGAKNSVVSMADLSDLQVEVEVNENELAKLKRDQQTEIRLDSNPQRVYAGKVDEVSPQADRQKGTVQVKVSVIDPDDSMKTEVNARVTFLGDAPDAAQANTSRSRLWITKEALVPGASPPIVYVLQDHKAAAKQVKTGVEAEKGVEVVEGLTGSEDLIIAPLTDISEGARVVAAPQ